MALEVAVLLEVAEQVVERLLGHPHASGEVGRPHPLGPRPEEDAQLRPVDVVEAVLVERARAADASPPPRGGA